MTLSRNYSPLERFTISLSLSFLNTFSSFTFLTFRAMSLACLALFLVFFCDPFFGIGAINLVWSHHLQHLNLTP